MSLKTKADYYQWLMGEHDKISEMMRKVPKLTIEEQSRRIDMTEYDNENQRKINEYKRALSRIENEANRITRYI